MFLSKDKSRPFLAGRGFEQDDSLGMNFRRSIPVFVTLCAMAEWEGRTNSCCSREVLSLLSYFPLILGSSQIPVPPTTLGMQDVNQHLFGGDVLGASDFSGEGVSIWPHNLIFFNYNSSSPGVPWGSLGNWDGHP